MRSFSWMSNIPKKGCFKIVYMHYIKNVAIEWITRSHSTVGTMTWVQESPRWRCTKVRKVHVSPLYWNAPQYDQQETKVRTQKHLRYVNPSPCRAQTECVWCFQGPVGYLGRGRGPEEYCDMNNDFLGFNCVIPKIETLKSDSIDMSLSQRELVMDRETSCAALHRIAKSRTWLSDWPELNWSLNPQYLRMWPYLKMHSFIANVIKLKEVLSVGPNLVTLVSLWKG